MTAPCWAQVAFTATNGRTGALLQAAAQAHLRLRRVQPVLGGFSAQCSARHYLALARLARHYRVRLAVRRRMGAYFLGKGLLRRRGLWAGLLVIGGLLLLSQQLVWSVQYVALSATAQAKAAAVLRSCGIQQGVYITPQLLTQGETALVEQGGLFGWASLNFAHGRLTVETAPAQPVPAIAQTYDRDLTARVAGTVLAVNIQQGTAMVAAGQQVAAGQVLIARDRADRQGEPVVGRTAGSVTARFAWSAQAQQPLTSQVTVLAAAPQSSYRFSAAGREWQLGQPYSGGVAHQTHYGLSLLGLPLPVAVEETVSAPVRLEWRETTESLALALARLACARQRAQQWPDAKVVAVQEQTETVDGVLYYQVTQQLEADICAHPEDSGG